MAISRHRRRKQELRPKATTSCEAASSSSVCCRTKKTPSLYVRILFGSTTGTSKKWATHVAEEVSAKHSGVDAVDVSVEDLATFPFDTLLSPKQKSGCCS